MTSPDTIAAIATPPGQGGIGIIRISGPAAAAIARQFLGREPIPRHAHFTAFCDADGDVIDQGILLYFAAPASFTGEDVVECQVHGGPVVLDRLLRRVLQLGCRQARAGEFSERAFLNERIDLVQAEAIADLIAAESEQSARAAVHSLQGDFSAHLHGLLDRLTQLRVHVESALDFPEEEIDFLADEAIAKQLQDVMQDVQKIDLSSRQGRLLREGLNVVITGKPNAGKSSLLNALAGFDTAIVSEVPGTTRDVIRERIQLEGVPLHIIDTAGMRESADVVEQEGVKRARAELERADIVIHVIDASALEQEQPQPSSITVYNKIDLVGQLPARDGDSVRVSAKTGDGMEQLQACILEHAGFDQAVQREGLFSARQRHLDALHEMRAHLDDARQALASMQGEILAEELRLAQNSLSSITGEFSSDDLLGRIFSDFCIGK